MNIIAYLPKYVEKQKEKGLIEAEQFILEEFKYYYNAKKKALQRRASILKLIDKLHHQSNLFDEVLLDHYGYRQLGKNAFIRLLKVIDKEYFEFWLETRYLGG